MTVVRYIHQNPVKAGIVEKPFAWNWSSCLGYYGMATYPSGLLDNDVLLGMFSEDRTIAIKKFKEFNELKNEDSCMDDNIIIKLTDEEAQAEIKKLVPEFNLVEIRNLPKVNRDDILKK